MGRYVAAVGAVVVCGVLLLAALGFLLTAVFFALAGPWGHAVAAAGTGGTAVVVALLVLLVTKLRLRRGQNAVRTVASLVERRPLPAGLAAIAAGIAVSSPSRRGEMLEELRYHLLRT